ncbi:MAG: hypothetical protein KJP00_00130, partial [Bacteroidia bacterium]|nr:hypothetical protein [Bacteroidia bacterium]
LQNYIDEYQFTLWKFEYRGRLSKREKRQVLKMQDQIVESLTYALNNREVVRSWRNIGNRNGRNGRGGSDWQGNRNDNNRSGGMCPPPSRDNKPRRRSTF